MIRIECNCKTCKTNAAQIGLTAPLAAMVPQGLLTMVKGKVHGLVHLAHDPNPIFTAARARTGVTAA